MVEGIAGGHRIRVAADNACDTKELVRELRDLQAMPHVARDNKGRRRAIDWRVTSHPGYTLSHRIGKRSEHAFGWTKSVGGMMKVKLRG